MSANQKTNVLDNAGSRGQSLTRKRAVRRAMRLARKLGHAPVFVRRAQPFANNAEGFFIDGHCRKCGTSACLGVRLSTKKSFFVGGAAVRPCDGRPS